MCHVINIAVGKLLKSVKAVEEPPKDPNEQPRAQSGRGQLRACLSDINIGQVCDKIRYFSTVLKQSNLKWEAFVKECIYCEMKPLKVYRDVSTRWNSTCTMLERVIYLREPIAYDETGLPK